MRTHAPTVLVGVGLGLLLGLAVAFPRGTSMPARAEVGGRVVDAAGEPVAGATVMVVANPPRTTRTDPDGHFHFRDLPRRPHLIEASAGERVAGPVAAPAGEVVLLRLRRPMSLRAAVVPWLDPAHRRRPSLTPVPGDRSPCAGDRPLWAGPATPARSRNRRA